jgi:mono/diheme cytochrome c family protein
MQMKSVKFVVLLALVPSILFLATWTGHRMAPESTPVARGAAYAQTRGCIGCHGNPENPLADANDNECSNVNKMTGHPEYDVECADVMAYFETIRLRRNFDDRTQININSPLIAGEQLARKYHCFQCHGDLGQGGFKNASSFKGYVPGYFGADFTALTRNANPDSVREWILHGMDSAIIEKPLTGRIAEFFFSRQAVSMPSYKSLEPAEIEILVNYVIAVHKFGPMKAETVRSYGEQSRSTEGLVSFDGGVRSKLLQPASGHRFQAGEQ